MNLFEFDHQFNLLPQDGVVSYFGPVIDKADADYYFEKLLKNINWKHDEVIIYGKHIITARKAAWYGDKPFRYNYSNTTKEAKPWTKELRVLKDLVETKTQAKFNSCLLNLYHNGAEGMSWHSDDEKALGRNCTIASLSLGSERKFSFKHKRLDLKKSIELESGSLLLMKDETQHHWLHSLPKSKKVKLPRINLTFRNFYDD